jgi:hypothetical protein
VAKTEKKEMLSSQSRVNHGHTTACLHRLDVLGETHRLSIPTSQSELICKCLKQSALEKEEEAKAEMEEK